MIEINTGVRSLLEAAEILAYAAQVLGAVALLYVALTFLVNRNQLNFGVIASCNERFQKIVPRLQSRNRKERDESERQYVDLCNEQLFYFRNGYLPREVVLEWLDGMVEYLPQLDGDGKPHPGQENGRIIYEERLFKDYPRVAAALEVDRLYDLNNPTQREYLITKIRNNVRRTWPEYLFGWVLDLRR